MSIIDRWALAKTNTFIQEVTSAFEIYEFHRAVQELNKFCSNVLSSNYHDIIKDRLYTLHPNDLKRRSTQTALHLIFEALIKVLGPIAPFTADEAWSYHQSGNDLVDDSLVFHNWPKFEEEWNLGEKISDAQSILDFKDTHINDILESLGGEKKLDNH